MSILIRRVLTTAVALTLAFAALVAQPPKANADPLCVEVSYTAFGTFSNSVGHCQSTPWGAATINKTTGDPNYIEVKVFVSLPLP